MDPEEHIRNSRRANRSKSVKQKKVPQRGLGVAQLEKLRLEAERKKDASSDSISNPCVEALQCPNLVRLPPNPPPRSESLKISNGGGNLGFRLWNGERERVGDLGFAFWRQLSESNPSILASRSSPSSSSSSFLIHRPCSSPVNTSRGISPLLIEPPSNQNICSSPWPREEKMVGMKRSHTFSQGCSSSSSFPASDELPSCSNGYNPNKESKYENMSRDSLNSIPLFEEKPSEIVRDDNDMLIRDFLTLAPPLLDPLPQNSRLSYPFDCSGHQEKLESRILKLGPNRSTQQENGETNSIERNGGGVKNESIDLDLKL